MNLSELFVSHKQVENVDFDDSVDPITSPMLTDLARVRTLLKPTPESLPEVEYDTSSIPGVYSWVVASEQDGYGGNSPTNLGWKVKFGTKTESMPTGSTQQTTKKYESLAKKRQSPYYKTFRQELDKFIESRPEYGDIKEHLDYLASLESTYKQNASNAAGSGALGWFQFTDGTRKQYSNKSRVDFASDAQEQLLAAAKYYRNLQNSLKLWGGDPNDFASMYGMWWRPQSQKDFMKDPNYDYVTQWGESFRDVRQKAIDLLA